MVQTWVTTRREAHSANTVKRIHGNLRRILGDAVRMELLSRNVAVGVILPKIQQAEQPVFSAAQAGQLMAAAHGDDLEALYVLALTTGMREGELLGLKWGDIDWERQRLQIHRSLAQVPRGTAEQEPKTRGSRRGIPLTSLAIDALKRRKVRQAERRLAAGASWQESDYIFTGKVGLPLRRSNLLNEYYYPMLEKAGLPKTRFHNLRHSTATLLLSLGVHPKIVQELLGHSNIQMTLNVYSHVTPDMSRDAINQLEQLLAGMTAQ